MDSAFATIIGTAMAAGARVTVVLLRLQWQAHQEHARQQTIAGVVGHLSPGSCLEDFRADGSYVRVTVGSAADDPAAKGKDTSNG
jgi:hypothetical protein